jgi:anti-sigma regulatory factor (Ser/Thr protein kinase)
MEPRSPVPLRLTVRARSGLGEFRAEVRSWMGHSAGGPEIDDIVLACGEAVDNALEHGTPPASVEMGWEDDGLLTIVVRDAGTWSVSTQLPPRGLGLPIMMALMDNVTVDTTDGTAIRLSRRF